MTVAAGTAMPPSSKVSAIRAFNAYGFTLIPLAGKLPTSEGWRSTRSGEFHEGNLPGNYGVALDGHHLVIDVDPRNFAPGDKPLSRLAADVPGLLDAMRSTFRVNTGGGGSHFYFYIPVGLAIRNGLKQYPGIEFKSLGRQVVGPGSFHPDSGKEYQVASGTIEKIAEAPTGLLALIKRPDVDLNTTGTGKYIDDTATQGRFLDFLQFAAAPAIQGQGGDNLTFKTACVGRDLGLSPALTFDLMMEAWNPRCVPPWDGEDLKAKVVNAYKFAAGAVGTAHPSADFEVQPTPDPLSNTADTPTPAEPELGWDLSPQGAVKKSFHNLLKYLSDPKYGLKDVFGYNEFTGRYEFTNPAPWHRGKMPRSLMVDDMDLKLLKGYLATKWGFEKSIEELEQAITNVAYNRRFHPVREYLEGLKWDGRERLDTWLTDYLGVEDTPYARACARKVLCAAVMRVMMPGIKFDHVLVLEGAQDVGKSTAVDIIGGKWAADAPVDPHSRDTVDMMQGRWIIELAEMEVVRRTDEEALKAFITRKRDLARLAFGRTTKEFPRQSIFIATKNPRIDGTYLKDDTGNRRWWPVRCQPRHGLGQIDFKGLKDVRDQLFAEAVMRMRTAPGEKLYMETAELKEAAKLEAAARHAEHEWTERIGWWLRDGGGRGKEFVTSRDVYVDAMGGLDKQLDRRATTAIASALRALGWESSFQRMPVGADGRTHVVRGFAPVKAARVVNTTKPPVLDENLKSILGDLI